MGKVILLYESYSPPVTVINEIVVKAETAANFECEIVIYGKYPCSPQIEKDPS